MMDKIADLCNWRLKRIIDRFISLLEPLSILFLGGIIAYIVISVVLPMFNIMLLTGGSFYDIFSRCHNIPASRKLL